jgi:hypothetical protein
VTREFVGRESSRIPRAVGCPRPASLPAPACRRVGPRAEVVAERERLRAKDSYQRWTVDLLECGLRHDIPRLGLWLDTSELTISQTVDEILRRSPEALTTN